MTYALHETATQLKPLREAPLDRAERLPLSRLLTAVIRRRRTSVVSDPHLRTRADNGVSPMVAGTTRGAALLIHR
jgi:hypothetical protein